MAIVRNDSKTLILAGVTSGGEVVPLRVDSSGRLETG